MTATASHPIHLGPIALTRIAHGRADGIRRGERSVIRATWPRRLGSALMDVIALLAVVLTFPAALLLVGVPVALMIALLLWVGRITLGVF